MRAISVSWGGRVAALPEVSAFAEAGGPDIAQPYCYGPFAPATLHEDIMARIVAAAHAALAKARLGEQMAARGSELHGNSPTEFAAMIASERERCGALIRGIRLRLG